jgi:hypothetical protein
MRTARQVAERAMILGSFVYRRTLEASDDPRAAVASERLLPWLHQLGCGDELDPIERRELATPLGQLSASELIDVNWAGEKAAFFCWMLNLGARPSETQIADQNMTFLALHILQPEAEMILRTAALRDGEQIRSVCLHFVLMLSILRERRVKPPTSDIVRRMARKQLDEVACPATEEAIEHATASVEKMTDQERRAMAGAYGLRARAAIWFLGDRKTYYTASRDL